MTVTQLQILAWNLLNDGGGTYYPNAVGAINEAQRMFVLMTLCLEATVSVPVQAGETFQSLLANVPDFVLARRVFNSAGQQLRPATLAELDALDAGWQSRPGTPQRYILRGLDFLGIYPQPVQNDSLSLRYVRAPASLVNASDVPQIRPASHYALANYAAYTLRQPEGGQEWDKFKGYLAEFMAEVGKVRELVKKRSMDTGYEIMPYELEVTKR